MTLTGRITLWNLVFAFGLAHAAQAWDWQQCVETVGQVSAPISPALPSRDLGNVTVIESNAGYARGDYEARQAVARTYYSAHPDDVDFLIVFTTFEFPTGDAFAFYNAIRNDTEGLGIPRFDHSTDFGSSGHRLQGYVDMAAMSRNSFAPADPRYKYLLDTAAHELMHRWAAKVLFRAADGSDSGALLGRDGAHWSYFADTDASVMFGSDWRDRGDGTFEATDTWHRYSWLDLYLAGLAAPSEVPPMTLIHGAPGSATDTPLLGAVIDGTAETVRIGQVIASVGARVPATDESQKDFKAALILLKRPGEYVADERLFELERFRVRFQQRFAQMTQGRGTLRIATQPVQTGGAVSAQVLLGSGATSSPPGAAQAVAWLESRQSADGHWEDRSSTALRDTAAVISALSVLHAEFSGLPNARAWLAAQTVHTVERSSARVQLLPSTTDLTELLQGRHADGGWGAMAGWPSSGFDTSLAVRALVDSGRATDVSPLSLQLIAAGQDASGAFGFVDGGALRFLPTLRGAEALRIAGADFAEVRARAVQWVRQQQQADGGFADGSPMSGLAMSVEAFTQGHRLGLDANSLERLRTFVDREQQLAGDWGGSVYLTALALVAQAEDAQANIAIEGGLVLDPSRPRDGDLATLGASVINRSHLPVAASRAQWFRGDPRHGGAAIGSPQAVPALAGFEQFPLHQSWDTTGLAGDAVVWLQADVDNVIAESSEADNYSSLEVHIDAPSPEADLVLDPAQITLEPTSLASLPSAVHVRGQVRNAGLTSVPTSKLRLLGVRGPADTILAEADVGVPARGATAFDLSFVATAETPLRLAVLADADHSVAESREENNRAELLLSVRSSLDLVAADPDLDIVGGASVGHDARFRVTIRNRGTADSPSTVLRAAVSQGDANYIVLDAPIIVPAGKSVSRDLVWRAAAAGPAQLRVDVDPDNNVAEEDETNNRAQLSFQVTLAELADLAIVEDSLSFLPTPALQGSALLASLRVRNQGNTDAGAFSVALYVRDPSLGGAPLGRASVPGLAAGAEAAVTVSVPALSESGDLHLYLVADSDAQVAEADEDNNRVVGLVHALRLPDVAVSVTDVSLTPSMPVPGQAVQARVRVHNLGAQSAENIKVHLVEGSRSSGRDVPPVHSIAELSPGATAEIEWNWILGSDVRQVEVVAVVEGNMPDAEPANNAATLPFDVQSGDAYTSERYISPDGDGVRDAAAVVFRLPAGAQDSTVEVRRVGQSAVRHFVNLALREDGRVQVTWDGRDDGGRLVPDGDYLVRAIGAQGSEQAAVVVTVDLNRSSILDAARTRHGLTAELPQGVTWQPVPPIGGFGNYVAGLTQRGLYRADVLLPSIEEVVSPDWAVRYYAEHPPRGSGFGGLAVSPDGSTLVFSLATSPGHIALFRTRVDQRDAPQLLVQDVDAGGAYEIRFFDANEALVCVEGCQQRLAVDLRSGSTRTLQVPGSLEAINALGILYSERSDSGESLFFLPRSGGAPRQVLAPAELYHRRAWILSPAGTHVASLERDEQDERVALVRLQDGLRTQLHSRHLARGAYDQPVWRLDIGWTEAQTLVVLDAASKSALRFDDDGRPLASAGFEPIYRHGGYVNVGDVEQVQGFNIDDDRFQCQGSALQYDPANKRLYFALREFADGTGISQFQSVSFDGEPAEVIDAWSSLELVDPVDQQAFPQHNCRQHPEPAAWAAWQLSDGSRIRIDGRIRTPSAGLRTEPWEQSAEVEDIWPGEGRLWMSEAVFSSLLNESAALRITPLGRGAQLFGIAADRNFAYYEIDWTDDDAPGAWHTVVPPSAEEVLSDEFLTWVPPQPGHYRIRLRVTDLAGNVATAQARFNSQDESTIESLQVAPRYISPNGDGVQDSAYLRFRVRQPATLTMQVTTPEGSLVRHITRTFGSGELGAQEFVWDGRNDAGDSMPDGRYRVDLAGFSFWITVDTHVPEVDGRLRLEFGCRRAQAVNCVDYFVDHRAADRYLQRITVEAREPEGTAWAEIVSYSPVTDQLRPPEVADGKPWQAHELGIAAIVDHRLRLVAVDLAGNRAETAPLPRTPLLVPFDILDQGQAGNPPISDEQRERHEYRVVADLSTAHVLVADAVGDVVQIAVETAPVLAGQSLPSAQWTVREQIAATHFCGDDRCPQHTDGRVFDLPLGLPYQPERANYWVRVRGLRADGSEVQSDAVVASQSEDPVWGMDGGMAGSQPLGISYYVMPRACGEGPSNRLAIYTQFTQSGTTPSEVVLSYRFGSSGDGVELLRRAIDLPGTHDLHLEWDTTAIPEGEVELILKATQGGTTRSIASEKHVPIVHTPPQLELDVPVAGAKVCARGVVEGHLRSLGAVGYESSDNYGAIKPARLDLLLGQAPPLEKPLGGNRAGELASYALPADRSIATDTFRLAALNWSGARTCVAVPVQVDNIVELAERRDPTPILKNGRLGISASGNDAFRNVHAYFNALEQLHVRARIVRTQDQSGIDLPTHDVVRTLLDDDKSGEFDVEWDGEDTAGRPAGDAIYDLAVEASDQCGNIRRLSYRIEMDSTPPAALIQQPDGTVVLNSPVVSVTGQVGDPHLAAWSLTADVGQRHVLVSIAEGVSQVSERGLLGMYSRGALSGPALLILKARDELGNASSNAVAVTLGEPNHLVGDAVAQPNLFSPNADGRLDSTRIALTLLHVADVTAIVRDARGDIVRTLLSNASMIVGGNAVMWDGRGDVAAPLPDGPYAIEVVARDPDEAGQGEAFGLPVELDTQAPMVEIVSPETAMAGATASVYLHVEDKNIDRFRAELTSETGHIAASAEGTISGTRWLASLADFPEGSYRVRLSASDRAGNSAQIDKAFLLDKTPPQVAILAPAQDDVLPSTRATPVLGNASDTHFANFKLEVASANDNTWTVLAGGTQPVTAATLVAWTPQLPDGRYALRLSAEDAAGNRTEEIREVDVDGTPPIAQIAQPLDNGYVKSSLALVGSADDAHFREYRVEVATPAQEAAGQWSTILRGDRHVIDGELARLDLVQPDGEYVLRLSVKDAAGLSSVARVIVRLDKHAPPAPLVLTAAIDNGRDALLQWTSVAASDLAGYTVYRDGGRINSEPVQSASYRDKLVPEGRHRYEVRAIDFAGNESAPSNAVDVQIDRTPPWARLLSPAQNARVGGIVDVVGTAYSSDDFREFRLSVLPIAPPGVPQELRRSSVPQQLRTLAGWDTRSLPDETRVKLHLEAEDTHGNTAIDEVDLVVDNGPPAAPTGLVAAVSGVDADVHWNPNGEADLLGYLLYRDGQPVNAPNGVMPADLRALALADVRYLDRAIPDGSHIYQVYAIDQAGNRSGPSESFSLPPVENGPPRVTIVQPTDGAQFERSVDVIAVTQDQDVAEVRFEFRRTGDLTWIPMGQAQSAPPYRVKWALESLAYGEFEIRAFGTDTSGNTDPQPPVVRVRHVDLTAPDMPTRLSAHAEGPDVHLQWQASQAADIAGYQIWRQQDGIWSRINVALVAGTDFVDVGVANGDPVYHVKAEDVSGNVSRASTEARAHVFTLTLEQPYSPVSAADISLDGSSPRPGAVRLRLEGPGGSAQSDAGATTQEGRLHVDSVSVSPGTTRILATVTDATGNVSVPGEVWIDRSSPPAAPTGVHATASNHAVSLTWDANSEPDIAGYRVFRDGHPTLGDAIVNTPMTAESIAACDFPDAVLDGDPETTCEIGWNQGQNDTAGPKLAITLDHAALITSLQLDWASPLSAAPRVEVLAWSGHAWISIAQRDGAIAMAREALIPLRPYRTDRLKLAFRGASSGWTHAALTEVRVRERSLLATTQSDAEVADGHHDYQVTAINVWGLESALSAAGGVDVGDAVGPEPVVLSGEVAGSAASLSWTPSASTDVSRYVLFRDGASIAEVHVGEALAYTDADLENGTYRYVVRAFDAFENASADSNEVTLSPAVAGPPVPRIETVTPPAEGAALDVVWTPGAGVSPVRYKIRRALAEGGPYADVAAIADTHLRDHPLTNGTRYYYVVEAFDAAGNGSGPSTPASGIPLDRLAPPAPVITHPTLSELPLTLDQSSTMLCGLAEPAAQVQLSRNGDWVFEASAAAQASQRRIDIEGGADVLAPAPDGRQVFVSDSAWGARVVATGDGHVLRTLGRHQDFGAWNGTTLFTHDPVDDSLWRRPANGEATTVAQPFRSIAAFGVSSDEMRLVLLGSYDSGNGATSGLWSYDLSRHEVRRIGTWSAADIDPSSLRLAPGGQRAAFVTSARQLHVVDLRYATTAQIIADAPIPAEWSPDGRQLAFIRDGEGRKHVWTYTPQTAQLRDVLARNNAVRALSWRPDAMGLVALDEVVLAEYVNDGLGHYVERSTYAQPGPSAVTWTASGSIFAWLGAQVVAIEPVGWFCIDHVPLAAGGNRFSGVALDASGNAGVPASPVTITRPSGALPDLALAQQDIHFLPSTGAPGEAFSATMTVRNLGGASASAAELRLTLTAPDGATTHPSATGSLHPLAVGEMQSIALDLGVLSQIGTYTLRAEIDPRNVLDDADRTNNLADATLAVASTGAPSLSLGVTRASYAPGATVQGEVSVVNGGTATFSGRLRLAILDASNVVVRDLGDTAITELSFGTPLRQEFAWPAGLAGNYRARAELTDRDGQLLASANATFVVELERMIDLRLQANPLSVAPGRNVTLDTDLAFLAGNAPLSGCSLSWSVRPENAAALWSSTLTLGTLQPGYNLHQAPVWSGTTGPGRYRAAVALNCPGIERLAEVDILVQDSPQVEIVGNLWVEPVTPLVAGGSMRIRYQLRNPGPLDAAGTQWRLRVLQTLDQPSVVESAGIVDLAAAAVHEGELDLATADPALGSYSALLEVRLSSDAPGVWRAMAQSGFAIIDGTPPAIGVLRPAVDELYPAVVPLAVTIVDRHSAVSGAEVSVDHGVWQPILLRADGTFGRGLSGLSDGVHTLAVRARDSWNNEAQGSDRTFNVDATPPDISLLGVSDGQVVNHPVSLEVVVQDVHLASTEVFLNGAAYTSGTLIANDGAYALTVRASDSAGNQAARIATFVIDSAAPSVRITSPADGALVSTQVIDVEVASEATANLALDSGAFRGEAIADAQGKGVFHKVPLQVGANTLSVTASDRAGNISAPALALVTYRPSALSGSLADVPPSVLRDAPLPASYSLHNLTANAIAALPVRVELRTFDSDDTLAFSAVSVDLSAMGDVTAQTTLATAGLPAGSYRVLLLAQPAGSSAWQTLDAVSTSIVARCESVSDRIFRNGFDGPDDKIFCHGFEVDVAPQRLTGVHGSASQTLDFLWPTWASAMRRAVHAPRLMAAWHDHRGDPAGLWRLVQHMLAERQRRILEAAARMTVQCCSAQHRAREAPHES